MGPESSTTHITPLADAAWLVRHLAEVRVADVRWTLGAPARGRAGYEAGHIPGAVFVDLEETLSAPGRPGPGRHPLPERERFAEAMGALGIGDRTHVVAYDDAGGASAARLWWLLLHHGHARAQVLDGGLAAWVAAGGALVRDVPSYPRARFTPRPPLVRAVDRGHVEAGMGRALLLDARVRERYQGRVEPIDPRPGHIPGARSAPFPENLDAAGRFQAPEALRARYARLGAFEPGREVICYCGSGVTACHDVLAVVVAGGEPPSLYEGSWSDWSRDPALPAALGPEPGDAGEDR